MNTNPPTAEQFLAQHEPDEDEPDFTPQGSDTFVAVLNDPMERIADSLSRLADHFDGTQAFTAELSSTDVHSVVAEANMDLVAELADLEAKHQTVLQVISDVEAALGKSKAAPALAAKAVIDAWRNPQVPEEPEGEITGNEGLDNALEGDPSCKCGTPESEHDSVDPPHGFVLQGYDEEPEAEPSQVEPTVDLGLHTKVPHPDGFDFCQECSGATQQWVQWPCTGAGGVVVEPEAPVSQVPQQPEHNAPVEAWREYARALGYAGPEIDKANRSVIRTTLGIAQPVKTEGGA